MPPANKKTHPWAFFLITALILSACNPKPAEAKSGTLRILAVETFLADITKNVAGDRAQVDSLIPVGLDPHAFEPTPRDVARIADNKILVINGGGVEAWLNNVLSNTGTKHDIITASDGLKTRLPAPGELAADENHNGVDPHYWLDPVLVIHYAENIRDNLVKIDPDNTDAYTQNANGYITKLKDLDTWIRSEVEQIPSERRILITNHETLGYFADRYGFRIVGTLLPGVSTDSAPSARDVAGLIEKIRIAGAPAIFLETGTNPQLAEQVAAETGVHSITNLFTHSITDASGPAPTYIDMMRYNTVTIVTALKP